MNNIKIDKFIKQYFGDVKTASPKYYEKLVEEINSIIDEAGENEQKLIDAQDEYIKFLGKEVSGVE